MQSSSRVTPLREDESSEDYLRALELAYALADERWLIEYRSGIYRSIAKALLGTTPDPIPPPLLDIIQALELGALL